MTNLPLKSGKLVVLVAWLFICCYRIWLSPLCSIHQTASRLAIKMCNSLKHLWALPKPTTFEKVDQTFNFGTESFAFALLCCPTKVVLTHNSPQLLSKMQKEQSKSGLLKILMRIFFKQVLQIVRCCLIYIIVKPICEKQGCVTSPHHWRCE